VLVRGIAGSREFFWCTLLSKVCLQRRGHLAWIFEDEAQRFKGTLPVLQ